MKHVGSALAGAVLLACLAACGRAPDEPLPEFPELPRSELPRSELLRLDQQASTARMADLDSDGFEDIVSVHESDDVYDGAPEGHIRIAFGTADPGRWENVTLAEGPETGAAEDAVIVDINGDGWLDIVAACELSHLIYFQNPGADIRDGNWPRLIPSVTRDRGSFIRVFAADFDGDGDMDVIAGSVAEARSFWFENLGGGVDWRRHDFSRRERGMFDKFVARDADGDGDLDFFGTRGNSGEFDGVFWLEQVRSAEPAPAFRAAREQDSPELPLPPGAGTG